MKKILITNRELNLIGGSETFTFTLAGKLFEKGLEVEVYSPILGYMASKLEEKGVTCKQEITGGEDYDVIHAHHFEPALYAKKLLPHVPMLFFSHGILPPPEYPPDHIMNDISMFGGVSLEIKNNLEKIGIEPRKIRVVYNGIDTDTFNASPLQEINPPYKILAITNHPEEDLLAMLDYLPPEKFNLTITGLINSCLIEKARMKGLPVKFTGPLWGVSSIISQHHLVIGQGRSALQSLACRRPVIIFDSRSSDGWVTESNFSEIQKHNFSGRRFQLKWGANDLADCIKKTLQNPAVFQEAEGLREEVIREHSAEVMVGKFLRIYKEIYRNSL